MASTGPPRDADPPTDTELWSLYLASEYQGSGVADRRLIRRRNAMHTSRSFFEWCGRADPRR